MLNPLIFAAADRLRALNERPEIVPGSGGDAAAAPGDAGDGLVPTKLADHTILVGYGRVGSLVGAALTKAGIPFLVIEDGDKPLTRLRTEGVEIIVGNAADENVFAAARPAAAARLILAVPNAFEAGQVIARARAANPGIKIAARAHSEAEVEHLTGLGADTVIMGEREIARGIVEAVLSDNPPTEDALQ